ncbi:MAG: cell division protein ZapA, partial [Hyphomicrobiales bacterium]|nr:cell division protein ZapA [Hyphomicrobiales bacterium]
MGQVTVTIADKIYRIACDDGQEAHLMALAAELDRRIDDMRQAFGEIGDSRLTV